MIKSWKRLGLFWAAEELGNMNISDYNKWSEKHNFFVESFGTEACNEILNNQGWYKQWLKKEWIRLNN